MHRFISEWRLSKPFERDYEGEEISGDFDDSSWVTANIPGTLVGHFADGGIYPDPYYGKNMKSIPGYKSEETTHFAFHQMPLDSPFRKPFWYRVEIDPDEVFHNRQRVHLRFNGINYRGEVWVNGKRVASSDWMHGSYRVFDIDITRWFRRYNKNVIALQLRAQRPDDLGLTFIDWSPVPSDDSAGIWQPVELYTTGAVNLSSPLIATESLGDDIAKLSFRVVAENSSDEDFCGKLTFSSKLFSFVREVSLEAGERRELIWDYSDVDELTLKKPPLWWPWSMGEPVCTEAVVEVSSDDGLSHSLSFKYGIREITSEIMEGGARQFFVNSKPLLIRGTAYSPDLLLRQDKGRDEIDMLYLKEMNFNTVRLEGKLASDYFWELCDTAGILVLAGWDCCTHWEQWDRWNPGDLSVAKLSLRDQLLRLRRHPSFAGWFYGSDFSPPPHVEKVYLKVLEEVYPTLSHISNASHRPSKLTGETGVKMSGPYGYVPPIYWYSREMPGYANSFNTETGPDSSFPRYESVCRFLPPEERYVGSESWNHHAGLASFMTTDLAVSAIVDRYGVDKDDIERFLMVAQWSNYEAWRAMYEAYAYNYPEGTGVIGWMGNGHWPSLLWQKFDYWKVPTGGFYGAKKACEPLHVGYAYGDNSLWIWNEKEDDFRGSLILEQYSSSSTLLKKVELKVEAGIGSTTLSKIDLPEGLSFLFLTLLDSRGRECSRNLYWLSSKGDTLALEGTRETWYYRPMTSCSDFSELLKLPQADLSISLERGEDSFRISVENRGDSIAFALQFDLIAEDGTIVAPVFWSENLLTLKPGERREVVGRFCPQNIPDKISFKLSGGNISPFIIE